MPPKKARLGNRGKGGGTCGKVRRGYGGRDSWRDNYRDRDPRPYWRDDYDYYDESSTTGEIAVVKANPHGIWEDETRGVMAPPHRTHVTAIDL